MQHVVRVRVMHCCMRAADEALHALLQLPGARGCHPLREACSLQMDGFQPEAVSLYPYGAAVLVLRRAERAPRAANRGGDAAATGGEEADAAAAAEARDAPGVPVRKHDAPAMALLCNVTMQHGRRTVSVHSMVEILNETHGPVEVRGRRTRPPCALALPSP